MADPASRSLEGLIQDNRAAAGGPSFARWKPVLARHQQINQDHLDTASEKSNPLAPDLEFQTPPGQGQSQDFHFRASPFFAMIGEENRLLVDAAGLVIGTRHQPW